MWEAAGTSDIGGRDYQEDRIGLFAAPGGTACLLALADGLGGHGDGACAAEVVTAAAQTMWEACGGRVANPREFLSSLCFAAHREINAQGRARGSSPRSTCVFLLLGEREAHWCHVGDSRLYHFHDDLLIERTRDHSVVQMLVDIGEIADEEMATHPDQNKLFRSLGGDSDPEPSFGTAPVSAEDRFVLCSDGLWEWASDKEMAAALLGSDLEEAAKSLAAKAIRRSGGSCDNVSVILARQVLVTRPALANGAAAAGTKAAAPSRWRPHRVALAAGTALGMVATVLLAIGPIDRFFQQQVESPGPKLSSVEPPLRTAPDAGTDSAGAESGTGAVQTDEAIKTAAPPPDSAALTQPEAAAAAPGASTRPVPAETVAAVPAATAGDDRRPPEAREGATAEPAPDRPQAATAATGPPPSAPPPLDERGRAGPARPKEARNIPVPHRTPEWRLHPAAAAATPAATAASAAADEPGARSEQPQPAPAGESAAAPTAPAAVASPTEEGPGAPSEQTAPVGKSAAGSAAPAAVAPATEDGGSGARSEEPAPAGEDSSEASSDTQVSPLPGETPH